MGLLNSLDLIVIISYLGGHHSRGHTVPTENLLVLK